MTYPNVLLIGYLRETRQLTPEWKLKLEQAISQGYQRLLTFEVKGGGFDWYGRAPANTILTAYGVLEFCDMAKVHPVDRAVIDRAVALLLSRQKGDGSWEGDSRWQGVDPVAVTAYVAWALREAGTPNERAMRYLEGHWDVEDPYVVALVANAMPLPNVLGRLEKMAVAEEGAARWPAKGTGLFHAWGKSAGVEATALATLALRSDAGLAAIARDRDPNGGWGSTQATILSLKALLQTGGAKPPERPVALALRVNGREIPEKFVPISTSNFDVAQAIDVTPYVGKGENVVEVEADADLRASVQLAGRYYLPWDRVAPDPASPLDLDVRYARTEIARNEALEAVVRMTYRGNGTFMVIVDLGVPPGFDVDREPFEKLVQDKTIDKYAIAGRQVTLYFGRVTKGQEFDFRFTMRPRFPVKAGSPASMVYEYYAPERNGSARPTRLVVR